MPKATTAKKRSAVRMSSDRFVRGEEVQVYVGARRHDARVVEERNGRVHVQILGTPDSDLMSSYRRDDVKRR